MSTASEPPYPPGRHASPAAIPARRARALPAAPSPAGTGDDEADTTMPRAAIQWPPPADQAGNGDQPGGYPRTPTPGYPGQGTSGYPGQGTSAGSPPDPADWVILDGAARGAHQGTGQFRRGGGRQGGA